MNEGFEINLENRKNGSESVKMFTPMGICHCEEVTCVTNETIQPIKTVNGKINRIASYSLAMMRKCAFTLAEVLITLGIIGVVAAMTLPTLIANYQKHVTVNRLKQTYSILYQAIRMSENENGLLETWDIPNTGLGSNTYTYGKTFFEQYLKPYIKVVKECKYLSNECWADEYIRPNGNISSYSSASSNHTYTLVLSNGSVIGFYPKGSLSEIYIDLNGKKGPNKYGKDFFIIIIAKNPHNDYAGYFTKSGLYMYGQGKDRTELTSGDHGCSKTATTYAGTYCSGLILHDGWKIEKDYPW